jgi:hypothetical protein
VCAVLLLVVSLYLFFSPNLNTLSASLHIAPVMLFRGLKLLVLLVYEALSY